LALRPARAAATFFFFSETRDFERPRQAAVVAREIKALRFSKIVLEIAFSLAYHFDEFR